MNEKQTTQPRLLVTGVTGYVGGRLVPRLLESGYPVRVMVRGTAQRLQSRGWYDQVDVVVANVLEPETLATALTDIDIAYYLIHSMTGHSEFSQRDIQAARNFGTTAAQAGVKRIIYLSGLGDPEQDLSEHLHSRHATGAELRQSGVPITEFRAGVVVGSGSLSFEMIRHLAERLPVMITPRWVQVKTQPIAVRDILNYLVAALDTPESAAKIIEIGGANQLSYGDMMLEYARQRGLTRFLIQVPVLTPALSSYWVHWMTPIPANIARPLIEGIRYPLVVRDNLAHQLFPQIVPIDYQTAVTIALDHIDHSMIETIWSDAYASSKGDLPLVYMTQEQGMLIERRQMVVDATPEQLYKTFTGIGGKRGWPSFNWLWHLRGILDRLVGGVGMRRGRRHPDEIREGEALDFWRVEAIHPPNLIRLRAEMRLPGQGWLQFEAHPDANGDTQFVQTAFFAAKGLSGLLYWYALYPLPHA